MLSISSIGGSSWPQQAPTTKVQPAPTGKSGGGVAARSGADTTTDVVSAGAEGAVIASVASSTLPPVDPAAQVANANMLSNAAAPERSGTVDARVGSVATKGVGLSAVASPNGAAVPDGASPADKVQSAANPLGSKPTGARESIDESQTPAADAQKTAQGAESGQKAKRYPGQLPPEYKTPVEKAMEQQINEFLPNLWKASRAAVDVLIGEDAKAAAADAAMSPEKKAAAQEALSGVVAETYSAQQADATQGSNPAPSTLNVRV